MDSIEVSINRLHDNVSRFIGPSTALQDIELLKAQIELRRLALRDIEIIHFRLRPFIRNSLGGVGRVWTPAASPYTFEP